MQQPPSSDDAMPESLQAALTAAQQQPSDENRWDELDELARQLDRPDEAAGLYREVLQLACGKVSASSGELTPEQIDELGRRGVDFHEEWFEEPTLAIELLQSLVGYCTDDWAFERLTLMLTMAERWEDLLAEYDGALKRAAEGDSLLRLLDEAARIAKDFANQGNRASDYLKELLLRTPDNDQLAHSLERRLEQQERHNDLVEIWRIRLPILDPATALTTRDKIASRLLGPLEDAPGALTVIEELLAAGGEEAACKLLEQLSTGQYSQIDARRRSLVLLRERYAHASRAEDELRVLELALSLAPDDAHRLQLHTDCTEVLLRSEQTEAALEHSASRFALDAQSEKAREQVRSLAETAGLPKRYAQALAAAAADCSEQERRIELLVEAGQVLETQVRDAAAAIEQYLAILTDPQASEAPRLLVARRLHPLLTQAAVEKTDAVESSELEEKRLLEVLEDLSLLEPAESARRDVLAEAAQLADKLADVDRSLSLWQRCLEISKDDNSALDARIEILDRVERWEPLILDLKKRAKSSFQGANQRGDLVRVARLYETRLFRLEEAIAIWRDIEGLFSSNAQTVDALVDLCAAAGRFQDVIKLLTAAVETEKDDERRTAQLARLGDVYREQENAPLLAVERYRQALEADSLHEASRSGLRALIRNPACAREALETLARSLLESDEWPGVLELVELRIGVSEGPDKTYALLSEAAQLMEQRAQDPSGSLVYLCRAFELNANETLEAEVQRLARISGQWQTAVSGYHRAIERCSNAPRGRELRLVRGQILETRLNEKRAAMVSYRQILDTEPSHLAATSAIARVATQVSAFDELSWVVLNHAKAVGELDPEVAMAVAEAAQAEGTWEKTTGALFEGIANADALIPKVAHDLRCQLALWYRDHRKDSVTAQALLAQAVEAQRDSSTLVLLAELQRETPSRALVETLLMLADGTDSNLDVLHEASQVSLEHVADVSLSEPILKRTLQVASDIMIGKKSADGVADSGAPESLEATSIAAWCNEKLVSLARAAHDFGRALQLLESAAQLPFALDEQIALSFDAAKVAIENLQLPDRSISLCQGILAERPSHAESIALLGGIFESENRHADLLALRRSELSLEPELERRLFLRLEEARILPLVDASDDQRISALRKNVDESPGHIASIELIYSILTSSEQHADLVQLLSDQAVRVAEEDRSQDAAMLWARAAQLCESALQDAARAADAYRSSVQLAPTVEALDALARLSIEGHQHPEAVQWLQQRLELTPIEDTLARRATIVTLSGELRGCNRLDEARSYLQQGLNDDPAGSDMRQLLSELYREAGDWALLAPTLTDGVEFASNTKQKVGYLRQAARVQRQQLNQLDKAIPLLQQAVELEPKDRPLRLSLADGLRHAERHDEAKTLLQELLQEFGRRRTPERAQVHYHLAQIARSTGDLDVALSELDLASKVDRNNMGMLELLGEVAREKGQLAEAERAYRTLLLLIGRRRQTGGEESDGIGESSVLFELHRIAHDQGQTERARELLDSALEAGSHDVNEARRLEQALRDAGQYDLLLQALSLRLRSTEEPDARSKIFSRRADALTQLQQPAASLEARIEALGQAPASEELLLKVWQQAQELDRLDPICDQLEKLNKTACENDPKASCHLCLLIGALCEKAEKSERAARLYALAQSTGHQPDACLDALERVGVANDAQALTTALRQYVEHGDAGSHNQRYTEILSRLGTHELSQDQPQQAAEHLGQALERGGDGRECLKLLVAATNNKPPQSDIVQLLESVARKVDDKQALLTAISHGAQLGCTSIESLREGSSLARDQGDPAARTTILEGAVALAAKEEQWDESVWAITALAEAHEQDNAPKLAAGLLARCIAQVSPSHAFDLRMRLADLARGTLSNLPLAASVLEKLLVETPTAVRVWKPLFEVYRGMAEHEKLAACIAELESAVDDPKQLQSLRLERVRILIDSDRRDEAESTLSDFIQDHPSCEEASDLLEDLFEQQGRLGELHQMLEQRLNIARDKGDPELITRRTLRLGNILATSDPEAALEVYRASLALAANDQKLLEAFLAHLESDAHTSERIDILTRLVGVQIGDRAEANALTLVELHKSQQDATGVEAALSLGLTQVPGSATLHQARVAWFRDLEDWENLAFALCAQADHTKIPEVALETRKFAADIYDKQLHNPRCAAETLALSIDPHLPDPEFLASIAQLWLAAEEREQTMTYLTQAIDAHPDDSPQLVQLLTQRGTLHRELDSDSLEHLKAAAADLQRVADLDPNFNTRILAEVLENKLSLLRTTGVPEREQGATILQLARVLQGLKELDPAASLLQDWLGQNPEDKQGQEQLGQLSAAREDWQTAADAYQGLIALCEGEEQTNAAVKLAEACEKSGDPLAAREALESVYAANPQSKSLRARLRQMYEAAGEHHGWARLLMSEAKNAEDAANRYSLLCAAGDLFMRADDAHREAFSAYEQALEVKNDPDVLVKAVTAQVQLGEVEEAARRLDEAIRSHGKRRSPQLSALQHAMAKVADAAGDDEAIFAWLEAALYSDRQNGVVASELATLAMARGEFDVAVKALQLVTLLKSPGPMSRAEAYLRQAVIARHRGDSKKSALLAKRAVNTDPNYDDAKSFLDELQADA